MLMLSMKEVNHFRVFGYVVLRGLLPHDQTEHLQAIFDREIETNPGVQSKGAAGTKGLSPYCDTDVAFARLIYHPGLMEAMRDLDGTEFIYFGGSMDLSHGTEWHCDFNPPYFESRPVKAMFYLDEMKARNGALYLIPGTHSPDYAASIVRRFGFYTETGGCRMDLDPWEVPSVALETSPGDVVVWRNTMWHYASEREDGKPRRLLMNSYFMDPKGDVVEEKWIKEHLNARQEEGACLYDSSLMDGGGRVMMDMASRLENLGVTNVRE